MYNLSLLSEASRSFLNTVRSGSKEQNSVIAAAVAKAISDSIQIPTSAVDNFTEYFTAQIEGSAKEMIGKVNEINLIDTRLTLEYVRNLTNIRYRLVYPQDKIFTAQSCEFATFFGVGTLVSREFDSLIEKNVNELVRLYNGFTVVLKEFKPSVQTPEVVAA